MQVSELEALDPGQRIRITLDDNRSQMWVKHDNGTFVYNSVFAYPHTFTAPCAADRVVVIENDAVTLADLPKYRFIPDWADAEGRTEWVRSLRGTVFSGVPASLRTNQEYDEEYVCLILPEHHGSFREVLEAQCEAYGIPRSLIGMYFRFMRNVEPLDDREATLHSLPLIRFLRDETERIHGSEMRPWFGDEEIAEMRATPVTNAGSYTHAMIAPEGADRGGFVLDGDQASNYGVPEQLVGVRLSWARQSQIAPSEEEVAERAAARERSGEWFAAQPKFRVQANAISRSFDDLNLPVIHFSGVGTGQNEEIVLIRPVEGVRCNTIGLWEVTNERQQQFHLPLETVGMWGGWISDRWLTAIDPVAEWLDSLPKRRYLEGGLDSPNGDYMNTRPEVACVETDQGGGMSGLFLSADPHANGDWGFWNDRAMRPFIPEHLHSHLGNDLFGYWVDLRYTEQVLTPEEQEAEIRQRISAEVGAAVERMQRQVDAAQAEATRMRRHLERVSESLRSMLDEHDYDYGCEQDDLLEEVGYPRERPTETIWVEVKVTGTGDYEVEDSDIESAYDNNIETESSTYSVSFSWEREERVEYVTVEQGTCVCGDDVDDVIDLDGLRRRLRDLNLPGSSRDWDFEIVNCENG